MMRKNKVIGNTRLTIIFLLVIFGAGCSKLLDIEPNDGILRKDMYGNKMDQFAIKTGLYNTLQELVEERFILGELRGDLVVAGPGAKNKKDYMEFFDHNISPDNKLLDWSGYYKLINQCNDALVSLPLVKPDKAHENVEGGDTNKINLLTYYHIVGEVLWLRSWAYFSLVLNWGDVPFITEPIYSVDQIMEYEPVSEDSILDQLENDLAWAVKHIFVNWTWGMGTQIDAMWNHETVNKCAAVNLLADVLIYRDKFEEAWTQDVLLKIMTPQQRIPGNPEYQENWHSSFNLNGRCLEGGREWFNVMFRYANERYMASWEEQGLVLAFDTEDWGGGGGIYNEKHGFTQLTSNRPEDGGEYIVKPSRSAVINWKHNGDLYRGQGYSYYIDSIDKGDTLIIDTLIWKYIGISPDGLRREAFRTVGNIHIKRTCDLYLKGAEAAIRLGMSGKALEILNQSRGRIGLPPAPIKSDATIEEIEDAIMEERALELAFEGERWYDLVRIAKRRNDPNYLIDKVVANAPESKKEALRARLELQWIENQWKLPYSKTATVYNPKLNQ
jgi:hypothetical protein